MAYTDPENDPQLRLKLLQAEQNAASDYPDYRRGARVAPCGCLFFGVLGLPLLKVSCSWQVVLLIVFFALAGALLTGIAAAFRPGKS